MEQTRNVCKMYCVLKSDCENGKQNWVTSVKNLLYQCGFGDLWLAQSVDSVGNVKTFSILFKQRLFDMYGQNWRAR